MTKRKYKINEKLAYFMQKSKRIINSKLLLFYVLLFLQENIYKKTKEKEKKISSWWKE